MIQAKFGSLDRPYHRLAESAKSETPGTQNGHRTSVHIQLDENPSEVRFHRLGGNAEFARYLFIRVTLLDEIENAARLRAQRHATDWSVRYSRTLKWLLVPAVPYRCAKRPPFLRVASSPHPVQEFPQQDARARIAYGLLKADARGFLQCLTE